MLNKRGHIATWMILLGAIILVGMCIFSFLGFNGNFVKQANDLQKTRVGFLNDENYVHSVFELLVSKSIRDASDVDFSSSFKSKLSENAASIGGDSDLSGNFFGKIRAGDYDVKILTNGDYEIILKDVFVKSGYGGNEIISYFDLDVRFNKTGLVS